MMKLLLLLLVAAVKALGSFKSDTKSNTYTVKNAHRELQLSLKASQFFSLFMYFI